MFCSNCGKEIQDSAKFCNGCGNVVSGSKAQTSASSSSPIEKLSKLSSGKKKAIAIISGVAVLIIAAIIIIIKIYENKLEGIWYMRPVVESPSESYGVILEFYDDGTGMSYEYESYDGVSGLDSAEEFEWDLDDDGNLYLSLFWEGYYPQGTRWSLEDGELSFASGQFTFTKKKSDYDDYYD